MADFRKRQAQKYDVAQIQCRHCIKLLYWPSKYPDLNPISNLWSIISRRVCENGRQFDSVQALTVSLMDEWESIPN